MKRIPVSLNHKDIPTAFQSFLQGAVVYDSSCSAEARVWFLDKESGFYLKRSPKGTLAKEAAMTDFFHSKGLGAEVLGYESGEFDYLLTRRVPGEDCTWQTYLDDPVRLCDTTAQLLRTLHETSAEDCPIANRTADYIGGAKRNFEASIFSNEFLPERWKNISPKEAWNIAQQARKSMKTDTLLHGDYCLPNIMLDNWHFSAFIDVGNGGVGDKHIDLFWGMWSLQFNLKTDAYTQRFLDVYGREDISPEIFRTIAAAEVFG